MGNLIDFCAYRTCRKLDDLSVHQFKIGELNDDVWKSYQSLAFEWISHYVLNADKAGLLKVKKLLRLQRHTKEGVEAGFFTSPDENILIYRIYYKREALANYYVINNGQWLKKHYREEYEAFLRAGVLSYLEREDPEAIKDAFRLSKNAI